MRLATINKATGSLTVGLVTTYLLVADPADALPRQRVVSTVPKTSAETPTRPKAESAKSAKAPVLARNNSAGKPTAKTTSSAPAATAKKQPTQPKTVVGRCWKRLMDNVREVTRAHRNRTT